MRGTKEKVWLGCSATASPPPARRTRTFHSAAALPRLFTNTSSPRTGKTKFLPCENVFSAQCSKQEAYHFLACWAQPADDLRSRRERVAPSAENNLNFSQVRDLEVLRKVLHPLDLVPPLQTFSKLLHLANCNLLNARLELWRPSQRRDDLVHLDPGPFLQLKRRDKLSKFFGSRLGGEERLGGRRVGEEREEGGFEDGGLEALRAHEDGELRSVRRRRVDEGFEEGDEVGFGEGCDDAGVVLDWKSFGRESAEDAATSADKTA